MGFLDRLIHKIRRPAASLPSTLRTSVLSPCKGQQTLEKISNSIYNGTVGDFAAVYLFSIDDNGSDSWELQVINIGGSPSGCSRMTHYRLNVPSDQPLGSYCLWDGTHKNLDAGQADVSET